MRSFALHYIHVLSAPTPSALGSRKKCIRLAYFPGISANVQIEPPAGTFDAA